MLQVMTYLEAFCNPKYIQLKLFSCSPVYLLAFPSFIKHFPYPEKKKEFESKKIYKHSADHKHISLMKGVTETISLVDTPPGFGSISRLFLVIRSLIFSVEWLFYQPLWLSSQSRFPAQCEMAWIHPCTPLSHSFPMLHFSPLLLLCSSLLEAPPSTLCIQMTRVIMCTTANEFTPLRVP